MKKKYLIPLLFCTIAFISGCKKNYLDALPQVRFVSAAPYGTDSLLLTGKVSKLGVGDIYNVGFCYDTLPNFDILSNQVLLNGTNGSFSAVIPAHQDSTYYFKCFIANKLGYSISSNYKYTFPHAAPQTAPCSLANNVFINNGNTVAAIYINSGATDVYNPTGLGAYGVTAANNSAELDISFNKSPTNGIYTTQSDDVFSNGNENDVYITITDFNYYVIDAGGKVYVAENDSNQTITVSFCNLTYGNNYYVRGKITF